MIFKCKNCAGNIVYSPEKKKMVCPFCDSEGSEERRDYADSVMTICPECTGEVPVFDHTSATRCPYCDNYIIFNERVEGEYLPKMIIPFQLGIESCKKALREKFKRCVFAPTDFLSEARLNGMQGVYVPYWFYDYDTTCDFTGEGTKVRSWTAGNIQYTETSYYSIRRNMDIKFRKVPIDASVQMPDDIMDLMEPYDYKQFEAFKPEFLSGFYGEKYNMIAPLVESRARRKVDSDATAMLRETYTGYSNVRTISRDINIGEAKSMYGLLPVWKYIYTYKGQRYPFYVNGQTGKIVGTAPISKGKVWAYAGTLWLCLTLILLLGSGILGNLNLGLFRFL